MNVTLLDLYSVYIFNKCLFDQFCSSILSCVTVRNRPVNKCNVSPPYSTAGAVTTTGSVRRKFVLALLQKHAVNSLVIVSDVMQALSKGKLEGGALVTYLSWRYIALESGVFCINPAVAVPVSYQHTQRYW